MLLHSLLTYTASIRNVLIPLAAVLLIVAYLYLRKARRTSKPTKHSGPIVLKLEGEQSAVQEPSPPAAGKTSPASSLPHEPVFLTFAARNILLFDIARIGLILLAFVVAAGFVLVILPQGSMERLAQVIRSTNATAHKQEILALLYLGDEAKEGQFIIHGAVRNISTDPIEKLDSAVRLYSTTGDLLETIIVRMDKETIAPDEIAQFHLVHSDYKGQFGSYAADFRLREGEVVPYKDLRDTRPREP